MTRTEPTRPSPPPELFFLPDGDALFIETYEDGVLCTHTGNGDEAWLTGRFADAVLARSEGRADARQHSILTRLAESHAWLGGLVLGTSAPPSLGRLLLGDGLGMLFIEVTARCNERCLHCYAESAPERSEQLSLDEIRRVLLEARELGHATVQFTGGDPLTFPQLTEAVAAARQCGYEQLEIYTNGVLLDAAMLERLAPYTPDFAFSLYSHDAATHDAITRLPGSHRKTLDAIRRAKAAGCRVRVGVTLMPENQGHERHILSFLEQELGLPAERITFDTVKGTGRGEFTGYEPDFDEIRTGSHVTPEAGEDDAPSTPGGRRGKLCVASNGAVYPCIFSRGTVLGDIRKQSLGEIVRRLDHRASPPPSAERWSRCRQGISCLDCRMLAYALGTDGKERGS